MLERRPHPDSSFRIVVMTYGPTKYSIVPPDERSSFAPPYAYPSTKAGFPNAPRERSDHLGASKLHLATAERILLSPSPMGWFYGELFKGIHAGHVQPVPSDEIRAIEHALFALWPILFARYRKPSFLDTGRHGLLAATLAAKSVPSAKPSLYEIHAAAGIILSRILSDAADAVHRQCLPPDVLVVLPRLGAEALLHQATGHRIDAPADGCTSIIGHNQLWRLDPYSPIGRDHSWP